MEEINNRINFLSEICKNLREEHIIEACKKYHDELTKENQGETRYIIYKGEQYRLNPTIRYANNDILGNDIKLLSNQTNITEQDRKYVFTSDEYASFIKLKFGTSKEFDYINTNYKYYWVCQGEKYNEERKKGIIEAPIDNEYTHYLLKDLQIGDIILNYVNSSVIAVSEVISPAIIVKRNDINYYQVKIKYGEELSEPIKLENIRQVLKENNIKNPKHGPFEKSIKKCWQGAYLCRINEQIYNLLIKMNSALEIQHQNLEIEGKTSVYKEQQPAKNQILYGPPGTGKTYNTVVEAIKIIDEDFYENNQNDYKKLKEKFDDYKKQGRIEFITFHQSYSYEEFVEGIKPVVPDGEEWGNEPVDIKYTGKDGIFKNICQNAKKIKTEKISQQIDFTKTRIFKMSLGANWEAETEDIFNYCINNNVVALGWGDDIDFSQCKTSQDFKNIDSSWGAKAVEIFKNWMRIDDIILISNGNSNIKAIAKITGDYEYHNDREIRYCQFRNVEWLYTGKNIPINKIYDKKLSQQTIYGFYSSDKEGKEDYNNTIKTDVLNEIITGTINQTKEQNYVLIIDEINRGNISKIFGELITLIEPDKRIGADNEIRVTLPYSQQKDFGVPSNLYIIGTMNTADKSLALLDSALRRRFEFVPKYPNSSLITSNYKDYEDKKSFLDNINPIIKEDKKSPDYLIGHAYFMNNDSFTDVLNKKIIPLLFEYYNGRQDILKEKLEQVLDKNRYKIEEYNYYLQVEKAEKV